MEETKSVKTDEIKDVEDGIKEESKIRSIRLSDETMELFKKVSVTMGSNQNNALAKLIETYKFIYASNDSVSAHEIELFQSYSMSLSKLFMQSVEDKNSLAGRIETQYHDMLQSKDSIIAELQQKVKKLQEEKEIEKEAKVFAYKETQKLSRELTNMQDTAQEAEKKYEKMLSDKEQLNNTMSETIDDLRKRLEDFENEVKQAIQLRTDYNELQYKMIEIRKEYSEHIEKLSAQISEHENVIREMKLECERKILSKETANQAFLIEIQQSCQAKIDKYQAKYLEILDRINLEVDVKEEKA